MVVGSFTEDDAVMAFMTIEFYRSLYMADGTTDTDQLLDTVPIKVTGEMNDMPLKPIGPEEVKNALFQTFPTKALGPDGFPAHFFRDIGASVVGSSRQWCCECCTEKMIQQSSTIRILS
jgi:hypothetical protein